MDTKPIDIRLWVLLGYYNAAGTSAKYCGVKYVLEMLDRARQHCLSTSNEKLLITFSVLHAELSEPPGYDNASLLFFQLNSPAAFDLYKRIVSATTSPPVAVRRGGEHLILQHVRQHDFEAVCQAVGDDSHVLSEMVICKARELVLGKLFSAAGLPADG